MIDTESEQKQLWITEILEEASAFNLREEVYEAAQQNLEENPTITVIEAYQQAFDEWVK